MLQVEPSPISSNEVLAQLISGQDTKDFFIYDVSDRHLYGCKHRVKLRYSLAKQAVKNGYVPVAFQAIHWLCFVYIPVFPLGTYAVLERIGNEDFDAEVYRGVQVDMDWYQAATHWCVGVATGAFTIAGIVFVAGWRQF